MNHQRRLQRLETLAAQIKTAYRPDNRLCKDMEWLALFQLVEETINPDDYDLFEQILDFVQEAAATPVRDYLKSTDGELVFDENGKQVFEHHFFVSWLWGLHAGSWTLPKMLPRSWLEGFCRRYGMVRRRCELCLCGLGNAILYDTCPICGSDNLSHKYLGGPPWDSDFTYRSHDEVVQQKKRGRVA